MYITIVTSIDVYVYGGKPDVHILSVALFGE
jgi:hypothetical protein